MNPQSAPAALPAKPRSSLPVIIILVVLLLAVAVFAVWAFSGKQDYKNNTDKKIATAVTAAKTAEDAKQQQIYNQELKKPYKTYSGSSTFGSISFSYPLTYSAYVDTTNASQPIEGYFAPNVVPGIQSGTAFALRVELVTTSYTQVLQQFSSQLAQGTAQAKAYIPPKMAGVTNVQAGIMLTGVIATDQQGNAQNGAMLIIPVRDKTLQIYTESTDFLGDFNNIILPSLTFVP